MLVASSCGSLLTSWVAAVAQSWTPSAAPAGFWTAIAGSADGNTWFASSKPGGIYISTDSGATWLMTAAPQTNWTTLVCSADGTKLCATAETQSRLSATIYYSTNSGTSWLTASAPVADMWICSATPDGSTVVAEALSAYPSVYLSRDFGATWSPTTAPYSDWNGISISSDGTRLVAVAGVGSVYISGDSGSTWTPSNAPHENWGRVVCSADGMKVIAASQHIWTSSDSGANWTATSGPAQDWYGLACSSDGTHIVAAAFDDLLGYANHPGPLFTSSDSGMTWTLALAPSNYWYCAASSADGSKLAAAVYGGSIYTYPATNALTWTGAVSSDWNQSGNWDGSRVPSALDHVALDWGNVTVPATAAFATLDWAGGTVVGTMTVGSNAVVNWSGGTAAGGLVVLSNGTLRLTRGGSGYLYAENQLHLQGPLTNAGTVSWLGGDLSVGANAGAVENLSGGVWDIQCDRTIADESSGNRGNFHNAGLMRKSAGTGTSSIQVPFANSGGCGITRGTVSFEAVFAEAASAHLDFALGGAIAGEGYGRIEFAQPVTLAGTMTISTTGGYQPSPGDVFPLLSYSSANGMFTCFDGLDLGGGVLLDPELTHSGLTLTARSYPAGGAQPQLFISHALYGVFVVWPLGFADWTLESATDLSTPVWNSLPFSCGNQVFVPGNTTGQYFRLRKSY